LAAARDRQALLDPQDLKVSRVSLDRPERVETPVLLVQRVHWDSQDRQVLQDPRDLPGQAATMVPWDSPVNQALQVHRDRLDHQGAPDPLDRRDREVLQGRLGHREIKVSRDLVETLGIQDRRVLLVIQVSKERRDLPDL